MSLLKYSSKRSSPQHITRNQAPQGFLLSWQKSKEVSDQALTTSELLMLWLFLLPFFSPELVIIAIIG